MTSDPLAARVPALIAQWREDAKSARYNARVFMENGIGTEWFESRAMGRAHTYNECAAALEAALAAAREPQFLNVPDRIGDHAPGNAALVAGLPQGFSDAIQGENPTTAPVHRDKVGRAMWALSDHLRALGHPFQSWPDEVKLAFSEAMIADDQTLSFRDICRAHALGRRLGLEFTANHDVRTCPYCATCAQCDARTDVFGRCVLPAAHVGQHLNACREYFSTLAAALAPKSEDTDE